MIGQPWSTGDTLAMKKPVDTHYTETWHRFSGSRFLKFFSATAVHVAFSCASCGGWLLCLFPIPSTCRETLPAFVVSMYSVWIWPLMSTEEIVIQHYFGHTNYKIRFGFFALTTIFFFFHLPVSAWLYAWILMSCIIKTASLRHDVCFICYKAEHISSFTQVKDINVY